MQMTHKVADIIANSSAKPPNKGHLWITDKLLHQLVHYKELPLYVFMCHYGIYRRPRAHNTCTQLLLIRHGKDRQRYFVLYHRLSLKVAWTEGKTQADHKSRGHCRNEKVGDQYPSYVSDAANP